MKRASTKSYETYRNNYFKNLDKYGDMLSPVLDYNEYQAAYNDYYNARLEEGKDTKNINRLIINDQTFEYSITNLDNMFLMNSGVIIWKFIIG